MKRFIFTLAFIVCAFSTIILGASGFILWGLRLPRGILAFATGGVLSIAGGVYQTTLRNPLADPYILGVASASVFGAVLSSFFVPQAKVFFSLCFAFLTIALIFWMATKLTIPERLVLGGVVLNAFFAAMTLFLYAIQNPFSLADSVAHTLGYIPYIPLKETLGILAISVLSCVVLLIRSRRLDILSLGDDIAYSLGVEPSRERIIQIITATLPVAIVVSFSGPIGFLGLVFPHIVRFSISSLNAIVTSLSFLWGGSFLLICDFVARRIMSPAELPVGVITALGLSPVFLWVLKTVGFGKRAF